MSRRHALVKPTPDGLQVEDLGFLQRHLHQQQEGADRLPRARVTNCARRGAFHPGGAGHGNSRPRLHSSRRQAGCAPIVSSNRIQMAAMLVTFLALAAVVALFVSRGLGKG
jgi:hypothetical protein